jgi:hypothetical protein
MTHLYRVRASPGTGLMGHMLGAYPPHPVQMRGTNALICIGGKNTRYKWKIAPETNTNSLVVFVSQGFQLRYLEYNFTSVHPLKLKDSTRLSYYFSPLCIVKSMKILKHILIRMSLDAKWHETSLSWAFKLILRINTISNTLCEYKYHEIKSIISVLIY